MGPVTVLMPVCNAADTVQVAVSSALHQPGVDVHLLVVDDGSTDEGITRLRTLDDPRVRVVSIPHAAIAAALNHGYDLVDTPYVARLDADDYSVPERLARQLLYLQQHPDLDGVGCAVQFFENDPESPGFFLRKPTSPELFRWELFFGCPMAHSGLLMRTEAWRRLGPLREGMAEDYDAYSRNADRLRLERRRSNGLLRPPASSNAGRVATARSLDHVSRYTLVVRTLSLSVSGP
jgi:glycosyltransferase involved in cell wall biosynthesis